MLTVTSYPNRTSPVERGKWVLTNLLGVPPQPPPPNIPPLAGNLRATARCCRLRERMERHRANPVCAGCHRAMDPIGFALENFDGIGRWRDQGGRRADRYDRHALQRRRRGRRRRAAPRISSRQPEIFVGVMTEKMLTYALGRGLEYYDMPAVRKIVQ